MTTFSRSQTLASLPKCCLKMPMVPGPQTSCVMSTSTLTQIFSPGLTRVPAGGGRGFFRSWSWASRRLRGISTYIRRVAMVRHTRGYPKFRSFCRYSMRARRQNGNTTNSPTLFSPAVFRPGLHSPAAGERAAIFDFQPAITTQTKQNAPNGFILRCKMLMPSIKVDHTLVAAFD